MRRREEENEGQRLLVALVMLGSADDLRQRGMIE
jgi:hypothetical protein